MLASDHIFASFQILQVNKEFIVVYLIIRDTLLELNPNNVLPGFFRCGMCLECIHVFFLVYLISFQGGE